MDLIGYIKIVAGEGVLWGLERFWDHVCWQRQSSFIFIVQINQVRVDCLDTELYMPSSTLLKGRIQFFKVTFINFSRERDYEL